MLKQLGIKLLKEECWYNTNIPGKIYKLAQNCLGQVGDCWMKDRLLEGDYVLCLKASGDNFFQYILLNVNLNSFGGIPESEFGSYAFPVSEFEWQPVKREIITLVNGGTLQTDFEKHNTYEQGLWEYLKDCPRGLTGQCR